MFMSVREGFFDLNVMQSKFAKKKFNRGKKRLRYLDDLMSLLM